jgi:hypothetical protein
MRITPITNANRHEYFMVFRIARDVNGNIVLQKNTNCCIEGVQQSQLPKNKFLIGSIARKTKRICVVNASDLI